MPVTYYCPSCWYEVGREINCPQCGADVRDCADESYEQKLIRALRHPEPTVPVRAAKILGDLGSKAAVGPLIEVADSTLDPYIQEAAVIALGRIGDTQALPTLDRPRREGMLRVRNAAQKAIRELRGAA